MRNRGISITPSWVFVSVFDYITNYQNQGNLVTIYFDDTYAKQFAKYGGNVIRGLYVTSGSNRIYRPNHLISVSGKIKLNGTTQWNYGYKYYAYGNI
jgi:hypothetical protein